MKKTFFLCAIWATVMLCACGSNSPTPPDESETPGELSPAPVTITTDEGAQVLEALLGSEDEATGNLMSYGYEGTVTIEDTDFYNYRVSWLVDHDHLSYLTNYLVSLDGKIVQEYLPES